MATTDASPKPVLKSYLLTNPYSAMILIKEYRIFSFVVISESEAKARTYYPQDDNNDNRVRLVYENGKRVWKTDKPTYFFGLVEWYPRTWVDASDIHKIHVEELDECDYEKEGHIRGIYRLKMKEC